MKTAISILFVPTKLKQDVHNMVGFHKVNSETRRDTNKWLVSPCNHSSDPFPCPWLVTKVGWLFIMFLFQSTKLSVYFLSLVTVLNVCKNFHILHCFYFLVVVLSWQQLVGTTREEENGPGGQYLWRCVWWRWQWETSAPLHPD